MTCILHQHPRGCKIAQVLFSLILLTVEIPRVAAAELWNYIRVEKDYMAEPKWASRSGKAKVEIRGDRVEIRIDYANTDDGLDKAAVVIVGTIRADHTIKASCTFLNTDANPIQLNGHYFTRNDLEIWGEKRKIITYKEIVFLRSSYIDLFGFLTREVRDE